MKEEEVLGIQIRFIECEGDRREKNIKISPLKEQRRW